MASSTSAAAPPAAAATSSSAASTSSTASSETTDALSGSKRKTPDANVTTTPSSTSPASSSTSSSASSAAAAAAVKALALSSSTGGEAKALALSSSTDGATPRLKYLTPSLLGNHEIEDSLRVLSDWVFKNGDKANLELEAKVGTLIDKTTDARARLPLLSESAVSDGSWYRFESRVSEEYFMQLNSTLNARVAEVHRPDYKGSKITYAHTHERDRFYWGSVRVSLSPDGSQVIRSIMKKRLADINFTSPSNPFDFRVSISVEENVTMPSMDVRADFERLKERLSYRFEVWSIDLTKVTTMQQFGAPQTTYEVEIELVDGALLLREREALARREPNGFLLLVQTLLHQIRTLIAIPRRARPPSLSHSSSGRQ